MLPPDTIASAGFTSPITRLAVQPDKTYVVRVDVGWESFAQPRVELVPLRPGSLAEERAQRTITTAQQIELAADSAELEEVMSPGMLKNRFDACRAASAERLASVDDERSQDLRE